MFAGVYRMYETEGVPLDVLIPMLAEEFNAIPCWISLYRDARRNGMAHKRILSMLQYPIVDAYGEGFKSQVFKVLENLHEIKHPCLDISVEWKDR